MITLNIIPDELKNEIKLNDHYVFYKKVMSLILFMAIFFSAVLLTAKIILATQQSDTDQQNTIITKSSENYSKQINEINIQLKEIKSIQNNDINWTDFFLSMNDFIGNEIKISRLYAGKNDNSLRISGIAKSRNDLLAFKEKLEKSEKFSNINLPISSLLEKENINFEISATITSYDFK
ncbi:MAG: hypothetical protein US83_C0002G0090 [Candidatus Falkowbacteria bacterium GW2011_GWC2_38_22]|uniref:Fimbrial assembly family protein n=1 Tax=Candidatus Falkowbacteria bacterium GW2011_GWE1_38_31 TaxID=1618638 RepID=A0A0G0JVQ0_9BACT|nr:MAG: hypothetical protein US73_C0007G0090 [Candidatus Falkowbacteria bacterium GW2011_GWF2_38_1205]KKQ62001.1 MAG: hypothetical protein US83_C0002G0090 [Candidatus Falkowbacteria bacterium GW2011_GWC2_38_22]KKQ63837.1 MAG: hypothetical protein US84_C0003G0027 [Candidatus Falkowbacteria bacterium GW2011_GWF1_38_22]KKQ66094.1 MAG: hypothetical protein US87_C0003G0027 [Candidatus Falkowbacteria bacterium GW2011_GWE2_38_254]KKQ70697.1 MAG: hypothetical protein US91_C0003G0027 [Candidatus Falkowb